MSIRNSLNTGWRCPVCGAGVAPNEHRCDHGGFYAVPPMHLPTPPLNPYPPPPPMYPTPPGDHPYWPRVGDYSPHPDVVPLMPTGPVYGPGSGI